MIARDLTMDYCREQLAPRFLKDAESLRYSTCSRSGHAETGYITFSPNEKKVFVKKYFHPESTDSPAYLLQRDPRLLYFQEKRNIQRIRSISQELVPAMVGSDDDRLNLFFEYLTAPSDRELFLKACQKEDPSEKLGLIYDGAQKIAGFSGKMESNPAPFQFDLTEKRHTVEAGTQQLTDYLIQIVQYQQRVVKKDEGFPQNGDLIRDFIKEKYNINLIEKAEEIVRNSLLLKVQYYSLQHGDCRVQHILGKKFVDLEQFGLHTKGYDLVTYLNAEGEISAPPPEELPQLLAWFLAHEKANTEGQKKKRKRMLGEIKSRGRSRVMELVSQAEHSQLLANYLVMDVIENLHLDSSNKRYDQVHLDEIIKGIPNYSLEQMRTARLDHINKVFTVVSENNLIWDSLGEKSAVLRKFFYGMGDLLLRLELMDVKSEVLDRLNTG